MVTSRPALVVTSRRRVLAYCDMRTLYLRNVPDDVVDRLEALSREAGMSVSAYAVKGLTALSAREHNRRLLASVPRVDGISLDQVVAEVHRGRESR